MARPLILKSARYQSEGGTLITSNFIVQQFE